MPKIRNISGEDRILPWMNNRLCLDGQVVEVPAGQVFAYTQQLATWAPADDAAQAEHDEALEAIAALEVETNPDSAKALVTAHAGALVKRLAGMDAADVEALVVEENERPKPRKTVLAAAERRLAELAATTDDDQDQPGPGDTKPQEG